MKPKKQSVKAWAVTDENGKIIQCTSVHRGLAETGLTILPTKINAAIFVTDNRRIHPVTITFDT